MNKKLIIKAFFLVLTLSGIVFINFECTDSTAQGVPDVIDYNFHVRPILSDRCFACHGPDAKKREANLRLDTEDGAFAALQDNPKAHAVVKGSPEKSDLYQRIITKDTALRMPPPSSNLTLTEDEVKIIKKWISQGAKTKKHWAFISPEKAALPKADKAWVKNEIDYFVFDKMKSVGLSPSEQADKESLLKRLSFDLVGLPPSVEMQEAFLKDDSPLLIQLLPNCQQLNQQNIHQLYTLETKHLFFFELLFLNPLLSKL